MAKRTSKKSAKGAKPTLLAGGTPQIAKADGDGPVQAYIAAMPGLENARSGAVSTRSSRAPSPRLAHSYGLDACGRG